MLGRKLGKRDPVRSCCRPLCILRWLRRVNPKCGHQLPITRKSANGFVPFLFKPTTLWSQKPDRVPRKRIPCMPRFASTFSPLGRETSRKKHHIKYHIPKDRSRLPFPLTDHSTHTTTLCTSYQMVFSFLTICKKEAQQYTSFPAAYHTHAQPLFTHIAWTYHFPPISQMKTTSSPSIDKKQHQVLGVARFRVMPYSGDDRRSSRRTAIIRHRRPKEILGVSTCSPPGWWPRLHHRS